MSFYSSLIYLELDHDHIDKEPIGTIIRHLNDIISGPIILSPVKW